MKPRRGRRTASPRRFRSPGGRPLTLCTVNIADTSWDNGTLLSLLDGSTGAPTADTLSHDMQPSVASLNNLVRNGLIKRSLFPAKSQSKKHEQEQEIREELIPYMNVSGVKPESFPVGRSRRPFAEAMFTRPEVLRTRNGRNRDMVPVPVVKPIPIVYSTLPKRKLAQDLLSEPDWSIEKALPLLREMLGPKTALVLGIRKEYLVHDAEDEYFEILKKELLTDDAVSAGAVECDDMDGRSLAGLEMSLGAPNTTRRNSALRRVSTIAEPGSFPSFVGTISDTELSRNISDCAPLDSAESGVRKMSVQEFVPLRPGGFRHTSFNESSHQSFPVTMRLASLRKDSDGPDAPVGLAERTLSASPPASLRRGSMFLQVGEDGLGEREMPMPEDTTMAGPLAAPPRRKERKSLKVSFTERYGADSETDSEIVEASAPSEIPHNEFALKQRRRQSVAVPAARKDSDEGFEIFAKPKLRPSRTMTADVFDRSRASEDFLTRQRRKESVTPDAYAAALSKTPESIKRERERFDPRAKAKAHVDWASVVMAADSTLHFVIVNRILKLLAPEVPTKSFIRLRLISRRWDKAVRMSFDVKAESAYQATEELHSLRSWCPGVIDVWRNVLESRIGVCVLARKDSDEPRLSQSPGVWTIKVTETLHFALEGHGDTGWGGELRPYIAEYRSRASKMQHSASSIEMHKARVGACRSFMHVVGQMLLYKNNINPTDSPLTEAGTQLCLDIARLWAILHWDEISDSVPNGLMPPEWHSKSVEEKADWQVALMSQFRLLDNYREIRSVVNTLKLIRSGNSGV